MRKLLAVTLIMLLAIPLFVACGNAPKTTEWGYADILDDSIPEQYELPFGQGKTISYSGPDSWYAPASLSKNLPVWQEVEKGTGVKFEWEVLPSNQWNVSMSTKINSGRSLPDMMALPYWHNADIDKFAREKIIIPLNELINKYAPNIKRILNDNPDIRKQMTAPDGCIYSIDEFFEANEYYDSVLIRADWLEAVGYANDWVPKTKAEFVEVMTRFKQADLNGRENTNQVIPLAVVEGYQYDIFCSGFGLSAPLQDSVVDSSGKVLYQRSTKEYGEFLGWLNMLYDNSLMHQDYQAGNQTQFETLIARNQVGITVGAGAAIDRYESILRGQGVRDARVIMIDPPTDDSGNITLVKRPRLGGQIGISYDCDDPVTVIKLMDYLWGDNEGNVLLHYGIEGKSYDMVDGKPKLSDFVLNNSQGLDPGSALRSLGAWPPLFDRQTKDFMKSFYPDQAIEYHQKNMDNGKYVEPFPKILPTKQEVDNMSSLAGAISTYQSEMQMKFILGTISIGKYESEYIKIMEGLGIKEYEKFRQEQYNRFKNL